MPTQLNNNDIRNELKEFDSIFGHSEERYAILDKKGAIKYILPSDIAKNPPVAIFDPFELGDV